MSTFAIRYWRKKRGHSCSKKCENRDLLDCYEEVDHEVPAGSDYSRREAMCYARLFALRTAAKRIEASDFRLVKLLTPAQELAGEDEIVEEVK